MMAEYEHPVQAPFFTQKAATSFYDDFLPLWARSEVQYAQNLLECSDEPIEYDYDDEDYQDNCFFFPEDCTWSPPKGWTIDESRPASPARRIRGTAYDNAEDDTMIPGLPDVKMLDSEALSDLLEDNLSPPEITSILVFATNGALFAYASPLPTRQLRNLSATYGAAYTSYAKNASTGNLTGVNPASHPSSYVTAQSTSLGDVGSIVFELDGLVAVVTKIADKVLLGAVGPSKLEIPEEEPAPPTLTGNGPVGSTPSGLKMTTTTNGMQQHSPKVEGPSHETHTQNENGHHCPDPDAELEVQYAIDRSSDLARLAALNLSASPAILLALESKSAALGRFLGQKLEDLEFPEDF